MRLDLVRQVPNDLFLVLDRLSVPVDPLSHLLRPLLVEVKLPRSLLDVLRLGLDPFDGLELGFYLEVLGFQGLRLLALNLVLKLQLDELLLQGEDTLGRLREHVYLDVHLVNLLERCELAPHGVVLLGKRLMVLLQHGEVNRERPHGLLPLIALLQFLVEHVPFGFQKFLDLPAMGLYLGFVLEVGVEVVSLQGAVLLVDLRVERVVGQLVL